MPDTLFFSKGFLMNRSIKSPVLVAGYGNFDREDDGVAWHILDRLAQQLGLPISATPDEFEFQPGNEIDLSFSLQLYPEMAEMLSEYSRVCFVDAHTGAVPEEIHVEELSAQHQSSPFTHHLTAATLLNLTENIYQTRPEALLISVRGYSFQFTRRLSPATSLLADQAVEKIIGWLEKS
jgi:hydrogenase maturation protease